MSTCSKCGYLNPESARFCQSCGFPLAALVGSQPVDMNAKFLCEAHPELGPMSDAEFAQHKIMGDTQRNTAISSTTQRFGIGGVIYGLATKKCKPIPVSDVSTTEPIPTLAANGSAMQPSVPSSTPPKQRLTGTQKAVIVGSVLIAIVVIGAVVASLPHPSATAPTPSQPSWHQVMTYNGEGDTNTNTTTFYITGTQFRISWSYVTAYPDLMQFAFLVYPIGSTYVYAVCVTGASNPPPGCAYDSDTTNSGTGYVNGPGSFYLRIIANPTSLNLKVEDYN